MTPDDEFAISGIRYEDQRFGSVGDMAVERQPCRGLPEVVVRVGPMSRGSRKKTRDSSR